MSDLYYRTSLGVGVFVTDDEVVEADVHLPANYRKWCDREFEIFIFGGGVDPRTADSILFPCRNLIGVANCVYVGKERKDLYSGEMNAISTIFKDDDSDIVFISNLNVLVDKVEDVQLLVKNLHRILCHEARMHFGATDITGYMPSGGAHDTVALLGSSLGYSVTDSNGDIIGFVIAD